MIGSKYAKLSGGNAVFYRETTRFLMCSSFKLMLAAAVALRQTSFVPPLLDMREPTTPAFMRVPVGHTGLVTLQGVRAPGETTKASSAQI